MSNKKNFVVSFEKLSSGESLMKLDISVSKQDGSEREHRHQFQTTDAAQLVGAAHAVGAHVLLFKFKDAAGRQYCEFETGSVISMSDVFLFADVAIGAEGISMMQISLASMKLHRSPTLTARAEAVAAWTAAERALPAELVVNKSENAGVIYVHPHPVNPQT